MKTANLFVVPNSARTLESNMPTQMVWDRHNSLCDSLGMPEEFRLQSNDAAIEIWATGLGSDNWSDHGLPTTICGDRRQLFVTHLPHRLLKGLKEGDKLNVQILGQEVSLICNQRNFRYRRFGNFEDALDKAMGF